MRVLLGLSVASALRLALAFVIDTKRATVCNGRAELCNRSYGNITFIGAHDSFAESEDPFALARDQDVDITTQLNDGVRLLQAQSHMNNGVLHFCHTNCILFDGGTVLDYLKTVKSWLDAHPTEVLTLLFTNPEGVSIPGVWAPAFDLSGVAAMAYIPPNMPMKQSDWPTLGELLGNGTRVVVFMDAGADGADGSVPFILPEFQMIWETPYGFTDATFPCSVNRTSGPLDTTDHMYMINHSLNVDIIFSLTVSDPIEASVTNSVDSILANAYGCTQFANGRAPNFILLDWVDVGQAYQAADILNGFRT
ncbi:PLC-like phosphodiesterase [Rickenella mellea]|uniref:PLC-like phosphodiesterase n=1 Tax=Rickenella mellea TaxID=50990 RepID=A0A4R5XDN3_9AGAM|nr:PLC-like phosphodiesterase [Rickenella mellea]